MQVYEIGYLILPSFAEDAVVGIANSIKGVIAKEGGTEIASEEPFKQDLAYTMTKTVGASRYVVNEAYLGWIKFEMEPENVLKVKAEVEKMDEVLRLLLVKAPRETTFTFAEARKALEEENAEEEKGTEEAPVETEGPVVE
jgi:ribosomal protein S6